MHGAMDEIWQCCRIPGLLQMPGCTAQGTAGRPPLLDVLVGCSPQGVVWELHVHILEVITW